MNATTTPKDAGEAFRAHGANGFGNHFRNNQRPFNPAGPEKKEKRKLPEIVDVMDFLEEDIPEPPELIEGLLAKGSKLILSGGSKTRKTWALTHLAAAVATGQPWWGFPTKKGKVLYINFEIQKGYYQRRVKSIKEHLLLEGTKLRGNLQVWNLRGHAADISELVDEIINAVGDRYDLIIFDPIYKILGKRDENSNGDIADMMNEFDRIIEATGAAVAFAHHYSKGNQAKKSAMDRMSGAGAFARDADSLLMMTDHQQKDTYTVDAVLRNYKPIEQFCITVEHPIMVRNEQLDPKKVKTVGGKEKTYVVADLMKVLNIQHLTSTELEKQFIAATGASTGTFDKLIKEAKETQIIEKCAEGRKWKAVSPVYPPGYNACNPQPEENGTKVQV